MSSAFVPLHHVIHFRLRKMAEERIHMNTQAGRRLRQATTVRGNNVIGSQPMHEEPGTRSVDSIPLAFSDAKEVTLHPTCALRRRLEAGRHLLERSCEPVRSGKNDRGSKAECIRRWRNFPMKYAVPMENSSPL